MKLQQDETKVNPNWAQYQERFNTLPVYFFRCLNYPQDPVQAEQMIMALELEIRSISSQFLEKKRKIEELERLNEEEQASELAVLRDAYEEWSPKATRAQKMKEAQIRILQAWIVENTPDVSEEIKDLQKRVAQLEEALTLMCNIFDQSIEGGEHLELDRVTNLIS